VGTTDLPNPGSGLDAVVLGNGHWVLIYNDTTRGRASLAISLSDDEGRTWKRTRHLEHHTDGSYHYPAAIVDRAGTIHVVYSYFVRGGKSMKHTAFNESWIQFGLMVGRHGDSFHGLRLPGRRGGLSNSCQ
jgi:predicted neuraminidase